MLKKKFREEAKKERGTGERSGRGGEISIKAGNELQREANDLPEPWRKAFREEGERLKREGKDINHPGRRGGRGR
jgi:hypothetical protein